MLFFGGTLKAKNHFFGNRMNKDVIMNLSKKRKKNATGNLDVIKIMNDVLLDAERLNIYSLPADESVLPCIYIVGAPRSGTTFTSQLLSCYCDLGYIDNIIARFWKCPVVGIAISLGILGEDRSSQIKFISDLGLTEGAAGPNEFPYFWNHWLGYRDDLSHCLDSNRKKMVDKKGLYTTLRLMTSFWKKPMLFKNIPCGFQADFLSEIYPKSFFIYVNRDLYDVGCSLLLGRMRYTGSFDGWMGPKPSSWPFNEEIERNPAMSAAKQLVDCKNDIEKSLAKIPSDRIKKIAYEDLIKDPKKFMDETCDAIKNAFGYSIAVRNYTPPPIIKEEGVSELPKELLQNLASALNELAS